MLEEFSFKGRYSSLLKIYVVGSIFLLAYFAMCLYPLSLLDPYIPKIEKLIPIKGSLLMMIMAMPFAFGSLILLFFIGRNLFLKEKNIVCTISTDEIICRFDQHQIVLRKENLSKSIFFIDPAASKIWYILIKSKNNPSFVFFGNLKDDSFQKFINDYIDISGVNRQEIYDANSDKRGMARKTFYHNK